MFYRMYERSIPSRYIARGGQAKDVL